MSGNDDRLDRLLAAPLRPTEDAGFSAHVMSRIAVSREGNRWLEMAVLLAAAVLVVAFLPLTPLTNSIGVLSYGLGNSLPLAIAAFATAASLILAQPFPD